LHNYIFLCLKRFSSFIAIIAEGIDTIKKKVLKLDKEEMDQANLIRVHWFNKRDHSKIKDLPENIDLPI
jgi:hypothetical protein